MTQNPRFSLNAVFPLALSLLFAAPGCGDDDEKDDGDMSMGGARSSVDLVLNCESDQDCNDGLFCNGEESCDEGRCVAGDALECDDGVECTVDQCSEDERACVYLAPDADGDGFASSSCVDAQGNILGADCDDSDPFTFPGSVEVCDTENRDE
ncbi:MAG: hypothetical protein MK135_01155, partial [Polyangiaceae bacterium]|nr:hypothetical protein [Polyangiaceae bacterium]